MKTLAIIGSGHLGQQIANFSISDNHYDKVVFFDDFSKESNINGFKILGCVNNILEEYSNNAFDNLIIGVGYNHFKLRSDLYNYFYKIIPFGKIIHSSCYIDNNVIIKDGCVVYPRTVLDLNVIINENTIINNNCTISHDTIIGQNCFISPNAAIAGFVNIDSSCFIGINATIIDNISIIKDTYIGAGTVVSRNILSSGVYVGNPMKKIK